MRFFRPTRGQARSVQDTPYGGDVGSWKTMAKVVSDTLRAVIRMIGSCLDNCRTVGVINHRAPVLVWSSAAILQFPPPCPSSNSTAMDAKTPGKFRMGDAPRGQFAHKATLPKGQGCICVIAHG